ncbi:MAG: hypothetical protein AAGA76_11985, partial [Pseudomonadota bacterium]
QSLPAFLHTLWLVVPPAFVAAMFWLYLNYRLAVKQIHQIPGEEISPVINYTRADSAKLDAMIEREMKALVK